MTRNTRRWALISAALTLALAPTAWAQPAPTSQPTSTPSTTQTADGFDHSHAAWNAIVSTYVSDGVVNYSGLMGHAEHMALLDEYIASAAEVDPSGWSDEQKLAFWTNIYNALVVDAVIENWPVDSVLNVEGFFDRMQYRVAGEARTLNGIEDHMWQTFEEPRMHFTLVCAAQSCPPLRSDAYVAERVEDQFEEQTRDFIRASTVLDPDNRAIHASKIFEWFSHHFSPTGGHRAFLARYVEDNQISTVQATVNFFHFQDYDWNLNGH